MFSSGVGGGGGGGEFISYGGCVRFRFLRRSKYARKCSLYFTDSAPCCQIQLPVMRYISSMHLASDSGVAQGGHGCALLRFWLMELILGVLAASALFPMIIRRSHLFRFRTSPRISGVTDNVLPPMIVKYGDGPMA